jgi:hypothetical protein
VWSKPRRSLQPARRLSSAAGRLRGRRQVIWAALAPTPPLHLAPPALHRRRNDLCGARDAGLGWAWLWGADVRSFADVERRLETGNYFDSLSPV